MIPRTLKRYSSSSSASARAGIKNLIFNGTDQAQTGVPVEEISYQTKTFEDGDASPVGGSPFGSRRSSSAAVPSRRSSLRASHIPGMTSMTPEPTSANAGTGPGRAFATIATNAISDHPLHQGQGQNGSVEGSYEHGNYHFSPKELDAVKKRVEEEFLLKSVTRAPLKQRRPSSKVPFEYEELTSDGRTRQHPSGFVVPEPHLAPSVTPTFHTDARSHAPEQHRGISESVINFADLKELATADVSSRAGKVPQEVRSPDGEVAHPSGFIPPTPQQGRMEEVKDLYKPAVVLGDGAYHGAHH